MNRIVKLNILKRLLTEYGILLFVLSGFVAIKIPHLFYPYYWDESWPYASAIQAMYRHGISLLPNAIDPELSHGHPLFFHAIIALWMNIFGDSAFVRHSAALLLSMMLLISVFVALRRLYNNNVAIFALVVIATQEVIIVQSSFVLPEMLIALLSFLSLCAYVFRKHMLTGCLLTALFLTKESGLTMGVVLSVAVFAELFGKLDVREKVMRSLSVGIPLLVIILFFILQKLEHGWFIFPLHEGMIQSSWKLYWYNFRMSCIRILFYNNFRFLICLIPVVLSLVATVKTRNYRLPVVLLPAAIIYYFVDDLRAGRLLPPIPFFIVFLSSMAWVLQNYSAERFLQSPQQRKFFVLAGSFVIVYLCFTTMNFITYRYLITPLVVMLILLAVITDIMTRNSFPWLFYPAVILSIVISGYACHENKDFGDSDMGAYDAMDVQRGIVNYFEKSGEYEAEIGVGSSLEIRHLTDESTGFLSSGKIFKHVTGDITDKTKYVIFDNIEPDKRYDTYKTDSNFQLVYQTRKNSVWGEIYKRRQ